MSRAWCFAVLALAGGCRFSFDKAELGGGFPPRVDAEARALVRAADGALAETVVTVLRANPTLAAVELAGAAVAGSREEQCRQAAAEGFDYLLHAASAVDFEHDFVCDRYELDLDFKNDECAKGHYENQRSTARFDLAIVDTGFCEPAPGIHIREVIAGEEEVSRPAAEALLARAVPAQLHALSIPWQAEVVTAGSPARVEAPPTGEPVADDLVLATFRGRDYLGLSRAEAIPGAGFGVRPMSCCFSLQPGDALQRRASYHLIDLGLGAAALSFSPEGEDRQLAAGVSWHLRRYRIGGGWAGGLSGQSVSDGEVLASLITVEGGYLFKLVPGLDLAALVGVGAGIARADADQDAGVHASASAALTWNPMPWWYLQLEVGGLLSSRYGDRLADGFSVALRTPTVGLGLGLELH